MTLPGAPTPLSPDDDDTFAPSVFVADYEFPPTGTVVVPPLPRSDGGLIQSVKSAVVLSMRDALSRTSLFDKDQAVYINLEYPLEEIHYPGIWVQFSITKLNRSGVGHEITVQDPETHQWSFIQEWTFMGRVTLTICALKSIDRDRLADSLISNLAFARPPEILLTKSQADTKQYRSLITALDENPYVAMTLQLDTIIPGGQSISQGTPWGDDSRLIYEDNYSFDMIGQFNVQMTNEGMYTLAEIRPGFSSPSTNVDYSPSQWLGSVPPGPVGTDLFDAARQANSGNTDIPAF